MADTSKETNTPGTMVGTGGREQMLALKNRKYPWMTANKNFLKNIFLLVGSKQGGIPKFSFLGPPEAK